MFQIIVINLKKISKRQSFNPQILVSLREKKLRFVHVPHALLTVCSVLQYPCGETKGRLAMSPLR